MYWFERGGFLLLTGMPRPVLGESCTTSIKDFAIFPPHQKKKKKKKKKKKYISLDLRILFLSVNFIKSNDSALYCFFRILNIMVKIWDFSFSIVFFEIKKQNIHFVKKCVNENF